jgi:DNA polymerase III sliding clamp (beta) subunit (PCNA family)
MINKHNLAVADFAGQKNATCPDVRFTPSETMATNGHYLVRVTNVPSETIQTTEKAFCIPAESLKAIKVKNGDAIELATNGTGSSWNLTTGVSTYHLEESEGRFPNVDMVMPKTKPDVKIGLNPEYLAKLATAFARFQHDKRLPIIEFSVWDAQSPIQITATNDAGQTMTALLMPMRLT